MTKSLHGLLYPAAILGLLSFFYREARLRFRELLRWDGILVFLLIAAPWHIWLEWRHPGFLGQFTAREWLVHLAGEADPGHSYDNVPRRIFLALHLAWWFPWTVAILPGVLLSPGGAFFVRAKLNLPMRSRSAGWPWSSFRSSSSVSGRIIIR